MKQLTVVTTLMFLLMATASANIQEDWQKCAQVDKARASSESQYCAGLDAVKRGSQSEAMTWFHKAADQNHPGAQAMLGSAYERGVGIHQSYSEAAKWYRKAAERGHEGAMNNLGNFYRDGQGVPKNIDEAIEWYRLAAEHGSPEARTNLTSIAPDISLPPVQPSDIAKKHNAQGLAMINADPEMATRSFERAEVAAQAWGEPWCNHTLAKFRWVSQYGGRLESIYPYLYRCYTLDPSLKTKYEGLFVQEESALEKMGGLTIENDIRLSPDARRRIAAIDNAEAAYQEGLRLQNLHTRESSAEAAACQFRALELNPLMAKARLARGQIFHFGFKQSYPPLALLNYSAAIRLDPGMWQAYRYRGELWEQVWMLDMALHDESVAILDNPNAAILYANRAEIALVLGKNELAETDMKKGRQLDPQNWPTMERRLRANVEAMRYQAEVAREQAAIWAQAAKTMAMFERSEAYRRAGEAESRGDHDTARIIREQARIP
jgi:TPR repeat protein